MKEAFYSPIINYDEERDNSIFISNSNQNSLFQSQENIFFPDEQQNLNKYSFSDYNDNMINNSPFPNNQQFSLFPSLNSNEEETNKSTVINHFMGLKSENSEPISNDSHKKLDEILKKDEKKNDEIIGKNSINGKLSQVERELLSKNLEEKIKENELIHNNNENSLINKKRKTSRIHLEDLNIDPKLIELHSYQTIGDKVITSKIKMSENDKKEVRAIRNRISAQKSRDRKKAEFISLLEETRILKMKLAQKDLILKKYKEIACASCKKKFEKIDEEFNINFNEDDKEYLTLEENNTMFNKLNTNFGKVISSAIGLICLIGIIFCIFSTGNHNFSTAITEIPNNYNDKTTLRHLSNNEQKEIYDKNVPITIEKNITDYQKYLNTMQMCHDKFVFDYISSTKNKIKQKNGFLINKNYYKDNGSVCIDSTNIEHNYYILDNELKNTLPVRADNIALHDKLSNKIISLLVKDYQTLKRGTNGKYISLQEQIELEAEKSDDGCVYIQMIVPQYENEENQINFLNNTKSYTNDAKSYFEIRCKIIQINNYDNKVSDVMEI